MEEVGMDTYFMPVTGIGNFNCSQLFLGFMSRMINLYPMPQKGDGHIDKAYDDFMRYEGVPSCLHRDLAPEQKSDSIQATNRKMMVRDSFSERGCPNQNPTESHGVRIIKMGAEGLRIRTGAPDKLWPLMHEYLADINNHCATPFLNWRTPIEKRHGYTPDISAYLMYQFFEPVYFRIHDRDKRSPEKFGRWVGVAKDIGDALTYKIYDPSTGEIVSRSLVRTADPDRGAIVNKKIHPDKELKPITSIDSNSGGSFWMMILIPMNLVDQIG